MNYFKYYIELESGSIYEVDGYETLKSRGTLRSLISFKSSRLSNWDIEWSKGRIENKDNEVYLITPCNEKIRCDIIRSIWKEKV